MTTTVKVTAHCASDTEVRFGITSIPPTNELTEAITLQDGESAEKDVFEGRAAVVLERKKVAAA